MQKTTQKELRRLVKLGAALDITTASSKHLRNIIDLETGLEPVAVSLGIYGRNGLLLRGRNSGTLYAITARTQNAFYFI